jgi:hypothetical protein
MNLIREREFESEAFPGVRFAVRRVSLAERLQFLAAQHDTLQKLKFLAAGGGAAEERLTAAKLESGLSRSILQLSLAWLSGADGSLGLPNPPASIASWLVDSAPAALCVEILNHACAEIALSADSRKK